MKKIYVNKKDSAVAVIEKIIISKDSEIVLYVPKGADLINSENNFKLIKRETDSAKKNVSIESSDKNAKDMADRVGLKTLDPLLGRGKRLVSDILPGLTTNQETPQKQAPIKENQELPGIEILDKNDRRPILNMGALIVGKTLSQKLPSLPKFNITKPIALIIGVLVIGGVTVASAIILPKADIILTLTKVESNFDGTLVIDDSVKNSKVSSNEVSITGEVFVEKKNLTSAFTANGKKQIEKKATGRALVYNAYSSKSQSLVKDTRLSTPDGKIFRLDKSVTIPGANIVDSKIAASSVEVTITADKPGAEYNVGPTPKFRIPGFLNTPKYEGFYAESKEAMSGGFIGEVKVPTETDIASAKVEVEKNLRDSIEAQSTINLPSDIKILKGSTQFSIIKEDVDEIAGNNGKFNVTAFAEMKTIGFKETDIFDSFGSVVNSDSPIEFVLDKHSVEYGNAIPEFASGRLSVPTKLTALWLQKFDSADFKNTIKGKGESDVKSAVLSIPNIKSGQVKLWPFFVKSAPNDIGKIQVDLKYEL